MADATRPGHLVFVGMMGSGKTTVGRRVARKLDLAFVDTDTELVESTGREIAEWFSEIGERGFRDTEAEVVARVLAAEGPTVVATGGGVVLQETTRALLADGAHTVVWLRAGPEFLASRLARKSGSGKRPLLSEDPLGALRRLDEERRDLYAEVADIVIDVEPVMNDADHPRRRLAALVIDTLALTGAGVGW